MSWVTEITKNRKNDNLPYFKGKISNRHISLNEVYSKENDKAKSTINEHIKVEQELDKNSVIRNFRTTAKRW